MQENLENNRRIWSNGTLRAGSNYMFVVNGKFGRKFIWSTHISYFFSAHIIYQHKKLVVVGDEYGVLISKNHKLMSLHFFCYI